VAEAKGVEYVVYFLVYFIKMYLTTFPNDANNIWNSAGSTAQFSAWLKYANGEILLNVIKTCLLLGAKLPGICIAGR
jgi:hypothetical protein